MVRIHFIMRRAKVKKRVIPTPKRMGGKPIKFSSEAKAILSSLPKMRLSTFDLIRLANEFKIPRFRGVFMVDEFPRKLWKNERVTINLDTSQGSGTHWVCYKKKGQIVQYFDSSGSGPPTERLSYYIKPEGISNNRKYHLWTALFTVPDRFTTKEAVLLFHIHLKTR